jgi:hypothetical protein
MSMENNNRDRSAPPPANEFWQGRMRLSELFPGVVADIAIGQRFLERGNLGLGVRYANGKGVPEDDVTAYAWFSIATLHGLADAKNNKRLLTKDMTAEQIAEAQKLSKEMLKKNPMLKN